MNQSWKILVLPTFPTISMIFRTMALAHRVSRKSWKLLVLSTFFVSQSWEWSVLPTISLILQTPNHGSSSRGFSKFMEIVGIVGFTNIFREPIMEIVGFTNNFHDFPNYGSGSRGFSKFMEIVGIVGFTNIFREPIMEIVGFTNTFHDTKCFCFWGEPKETANVHNAHPRRFQRPHWCS